MPAETVIILGGEKHEKRIVMPEGSAYTLNMAMLSEAFWSKGYRPGDVCEPWTPQVKTVPYRIEKLQIAHRQISAAIHPDITRDTGLRWLADMVLATWERAG